MIKYFCFILLTSSLCFSKVKNDSEFQNIIKKVEYIRGIRLTKSISFEYQSKEDFIKYLKKSTIKQYGSIAKLRNYAEALARIGVITNNIDVMQAIIDLSVSQAVAHYDPESKKIYILPSKGENIQKDIILAHELTHALQDQRFNFEKMIYENKEIFLDNADKAFAMQSVYEGDATFIMYIWAFMNSARLSDKNKAIPIVANLIKTVSQYSFSDLLSFMYIQMANNKEMISKIQKLPRFLLEPLLASYTLGANIVLQVYQKSEMQGVNKMFTDPPLSSEQIMHPHKYINKSDPPVNIYIKDITSIIPNNFHLIDIDVLGEMGIKILLQIWKPSHQSDLFMVQAAQGWGGDRYYCYKNDKNKYILLWVTIWDSKKDADEFFLAYNSIVKQRFPSATKVKDNFNIALWQISAKRYLNIKRNGKYVTITDIPKNQMEINKKDILGNIAIGNE